MDDISTKNDLKRSYILVTPAKNEDKYIEQCIKSVAAQSITPIIWIIVDDGSTDKTPEIIQDLKNTLQWIKIIRLEEGVRDLTIHYAQVLKTGFDFAIKYCKEQGIEYNYIAFLDADMYIKDKDFFKNLIIEFEKDLQLGLASGKIQILDSSGNLRNVKSRNNTVSGGEMVCRRECIENIGEFPLSYAPDSVIRVKAILNNWKIKRFDKIYIVQLRETGSAEGIYKGYFIKGMSEYYLNFNPLVVFVKGIKYILSDPNLKGIAYLHGYSDSLIQRKNQITDIEIRNYFFYHKPKEILQFYINQITYFFQYLRH